MITRLYRSQLDTVAYDACVEASEWGMIYGLSWWLDTVSPDWECLVEKDSLGAYRAVFPIPLQRKLSYRFVHQPLFCQFLAIYARETLSPARQQQFLDALFKNYRFVASLCLAFPGRELLQTYAFARLTPFHTHLISLENDYEYLRNHYNRDRKMNVKRAEKLGWEKAEGNEVQTLAALFKDFHEHQIEGGAHPDTYLLLEKLFQQTQERGFSELWYAQKEGRIHAGAWLVRFRERTLYLFNAADETGRRGNARSFLLDEYLKEKAGSSGLFDFESAQKKEIADFYASFGSYVQEFYELRVNRLPWWMKAVWKLRNLLR